MSSEPFFSTIVDNPWKVICFTIAVTVGVSYFLQFVSPSISYKDLFGENNSRLIQYERLQSEYTNDESILFLVEAKNGTAFTSELLSGIEKLTNDLWETPYSVRIDSITNHQHTEASGDDLEVKDMFKNVEKMNLSEIERLRNIAVRDPLTVNRVVNTEGDAFSVIISFALPGTLGEKPEIMNFLNGVAEQFRRDYPKTNVYIGGIVAMDAAILELSTKESVSFLIMNIIFVVILMTFFLRRIRPILSSIVIFIISIIAAMSLSGYMGWKITPFTATVPTVVLIIAVADCIHLITAFVQRLNRGLEKRSALLGALSTNMRPIIVTSLTTAAGLLTLNLSSSASVSALGNMSAMGVITACVLSLTLLPALLSVGNHSTVKRAPLIADEFFFAWANTLNRFRKIIFTAFIALSVVMIFGVFQNIYNEYFPRVLDESHPWRHANDFGEHDFGTAYNFSFSVESGTPGGATEPKFLLKVEEMTDWLRNLPEVTYAKSITDTLKSLNRNLHGDQDDYYRLPQSREQVAQYYLLYETSLPYGLELTDRVNLEKSSTKIFVAFKSLTSAEVLALETRLNEWITEHMPDYRITWSGPNLMASHLINDDGKGLTFGAFFGLLTISFLLIIVFGSPKIGLLSIFPNIFPAVFGMGIWGFLNGEIDIGVTMAAGVTIGIIVDDTVHFLVKYTKARNEFGSSNIEAVTYALQQVGPALIFTTIILVTGFISIATLTNLTFNSHMGLMTAMVLTFALLMTLISLPVLLMNFDKKDPSITKAPKA